jgi:hypothetical protein
MHKEPNQEVVASVGEKLTAKRVEEIILDCLFREGEPTESRVEVEVVMARLGFHPERVESHREEIREMLAELPESFREEVGGGWSFLQACETKDGKHWGEHSNIDQLLALGIATGQAKILMPRDMWGIFPGGMPYFAIKI